MLILNILQGPDKGRRFELPDHEPQMIGRSSEALPLNDFSISRRHAELTPDEGRWILNDLDSANGTFVNGTRITHPTVLRSGDQIRVGATLMVFGRSEPPRADLPVQMVRAGRMDASIEHSVPSNDDSVILAVPEPSAQAIRQLTIIYHLMQLVGTIFDTQQLLERVMDLVFEDFQADRGFILLEGWDVRADPPVVRYRQPPIKKGQRKIRVSRTIVQHVMEKGEGVLSSNAMTDSRFSAGESVTAFGIRSAICVPIKFHDRVFGVIYIDSQVANYVFTQDQLRLMTAIGAMTGMALSNAELYRAGMLNARLAAMGETVASLSHSIKNILQGMRGGAEVVNLGIRKDDRKLIRNGWDILSRNLDRIYELTMNMLAYSKQQTQEMEMLSLPTVLKEVVELIVPQCERRNVALITDFDLDMPPIPADSSGLHQAIMNLMTNALDAVEPGSGVLTLLCEYDAAKNEAVITVSDNGVGIDKQAMPKIFSPFYTTKGMRGTGLGLAVTKKIVEQHKGTITVSSDAGKGSTFIIRLSGESFGDPSETAA